MKSKTSVSNSVDSLFTTVVDGGYCIGCGACTAVQNSPISITLNEDGCFQATLKGELNQEESSANVLAVCPFSQEAMNEDEIGKELYGEYATYHNKVGYQLANYAGQVAEMDFQARGSSGGFAKWIIYELFREDLIDAVVHVTSSTPDESSQLLYRFEVAGSIDEMRKGAKSVYYPVEMSGVLQYIRENPGRYAITGVPCFIKAIRLLSKQDPFYKDCIHFCIGIVCGHLKSSKYAEMLAWQFNIEPGNLQSIDFRKKLPGRKANEKGVEVVSCSNPKKPEEPRVVQDLFGTNYGLGFFKYNACDYCDDVLAETADIAIGDAWLPEYINSGNNSIVVRNKKIFELIERGRAEGRLNLDSIDADEVAKSQDAGLRHRRQGLAYRLYLKDVAGLWRPRKRVSAGNKHLSEKLQKIYSFRILLAQESHEAYKVAVKSGNFSVFQKRMLPLITKYRALYRPWWYRFIVDVLNRFGLKDSLREVFQNFTQKPKSKKEG